MICPHDHQNATIEVAATAVAKGRPSGELIAHKDPRFRKNRLQEPEWRNRVDTSGGGGSLSLLRAVFGFDPRSTPPTSTINSSLCHQSDEVF